jgi:hypothetical protein
MKRQYKKVWLLLLLLIPFSLKAFQSNRSAKEQEKTTLVFVPQMVYPLGMAARQVTAGFELRINKDTVNSYLPYFGRAYSADYATRDGGAEFVSSSFRYTENTNAKGARSIVLKPKDNKDVREIRITIYSDGYAHVQLTFNQRQSIGYRGQISEQKN